MGKDKVAKGGNAGDKDTKTSTSGADSSAAGSKGKDKGGKKKN